MKELRKILNPGDWDLNVNSNGELFIDNFSLIYTAAEFGTPLYILNEERLIKTAKEFKNTAEKIFNGNSSVYYPFKCNSVPGIVNAIKEAGLSAEVMTEYELKLALKLGFAPGDIIVNGPCKTDAFLYSCIENNVRLIIVDSISELKSLINLASACKEINLLLRVNPGYLPKGLYHGSATGSEKSSFGLNENEILKALSLIDINPHLKFYGLHFHIGTGIRKPEAYSGVIKKLYPLFKKIKSAGFKIKILDVGGGFASMTTRELSSFEMLAAQVFNSYRLKFGLQLFHSTENFLYEIKNSLENYFGQDMPAVFIEPGRCIISSNLILLLRVHRIKERNKIKWLITDGGLGTITMPTYYEYHEIFLCNDYKRPLKETVTITGPCCFASDIVYKNKFMPHVNEGDVLALMDTGAYFNALESSFNFPKPAVVSVKKGNCRVIRNRETFNNMFSRDNPGENNCQKEKKNEIYSSS